MRNIDEQLNEITARSAKLRRKQKLRRMIAAESLAACVCLVLLIRCAVVMPSFETAIRDSADVYYGGLLLSSPSLGMLSSACSDFSSAYVSRFCASTFISKERKGISGHDG